MKKLTHTSLIVLLVLSGTILFAQTPKKVYTLADTLRGSLNAERTWWDVQRYELSVKPDYNDKSITGSNKIV
jgi:hypothetical protein